MFVAGDEPETVQPAYKSPCLTCKCSATYCNACIPIRSKRSASEVEDAAENVGDRVHEEQGHREHRPTRAERGQQS